MTEGSFRDPQLSIAWPTTVDEMIILSPTWPLVKGQVCHAYSFAFASMTRRLRYLRSSMALLIHSNTVLDEVYPLLLARKAPWVMIEKIPPRE